MAENTEDDILSQFQGEIVKRVVEKIGEENETIEYKKDENFGKGGFSKSYKCINIETKEICVLKEMEKNEKMQKIYNDEKEIHSFLVHDNIVKYEDAFEYNGKLYLLLEFCENKDLSKLLKTRGRLKEIEVQYYITNLIKAVKYLHGKKFVHRDIKPSNIFLTDKLEVKLGDFGLTKKLLEGKLYEGGGTLYYMAPEICDGNG